MNKIILYFNGSQLFVLWSALDCFGGMCGVDQYSSPCISVSRDTVRSNANISSCPVNRLACESTVFCNNNSRRATKFDKTETKSLLICLGGNYVKFKLKIKTAKILTNNISGLLMDLLK